LGRVVASRWLAAGHGVFATTRSAARAEEFRARSWEPVRCDVLDPVSLGALPAVDALVWCVGLDRAAGRSMREVYVSGLANVLSALANRGSQPRVIYVSSTGVYSQTDGAWVDESSPADPRDDAGRVALEAEATLRRHRPDAVMLRFAG